MEYCISQYTPQPIKERRDARTWETLAAEHLIDRNDGRVEEGLHILRVLHLQVAAHVAVTTARRVAQVP